MTTSIDIPLSRIEIRFAQMGYLYPQYVEDRLQLAAIYGEHWDDEKLVRTCSFSFKSWLGQLQFREAVILLLEDIAFRGLSQPESIIYSLIRETGCTPEQALEVFSCP